MDIPKIGNEDEAFQAIESWKNDPPPKQLRFLRLAVQSLDLGQMYYEQNDNQKGVERTARCIVILEERIQSLQKK